MSNSESQIVYQLDDISAQIETEPEVKIRFELTTLELPAFKNHTQVHVLTIEQAREIGQMLRDGAVGYGEFVVSKQFAPPGSAGPGPVLVPRERAMEYAQKVLDAVASAVALSGSD